MVNNEIILIISFWVLLLFNTALWLYVINLKSRLNVELEMLEHNLNLVKHTSYSELAKLRAKIERLEKEQI